MQPKMINLRANHLKKIEINFLAFCNCALREPRHLPLSTPQNRNMVLSVNPTHAQLKKLMAAAKSAAAAAYAPYSKFPVGSAVLTTSCKIFTGCNVENASYGLSNCAERTAIFTAVASGAKRIRCVVVYTPTKHATAPCGACRQVINEFGPDARVISFCAEREQIDVSISALLPGAFGPQDLT